MDKDYEDFISTVSHELRTPLTSIRGFSQTMLSSWDRLDDDSKKRFIKIIEEQSSRLMHLVENMLSVTKFQTENRSCIFRELNIKQPIEQTISLVKAQYQNQKFEFCYNKNLPNIFVDKDKFQQILVNLIENSAKYSTKELKTTIKTGFSNNKVKIEISNIGPKLEKDDYDKIFTKFSRMDNPLTRKVQGSGLGLYITKDLVTKLKGVISVNSIPIDESNSMITFTLEFPILTIDEQARIKCNQ